MPPDRGEPVDAWLVYDGQCPFCSRYARMVRLRQAVGRLRLVDAREGGAVVDEVTRAGLDIDAGMVLKIGDRLYHGADCIHAIALLSTPAGPLNRLNAAMFRSRLVSRLLYPVLRAGRNAVLSLRGTSRINNLEGREVP
jgi:predicted DCC family thiol-disulfide oxidoreductase YuxK